MNQTDERLILLVPDKLPFVAGGDNDLGTVQLHQGGRRDIVEEGVLLGSRVEYPLKYGCGLGEVAQVKYQKKGLIIARYPDLVNES